MSALQDLVCRFVSACMVKARTWQVFLGHLASMVDFNSSLLQVADEAFSIPLPQVLFSSERQPGQIDSGVGEGFSGRISALHLSLWLLIGNR